MKKNCLVFLCLLTSCNFYSFNRTVEIRIPKEGLLIVFGDEKIFNNHVKKGEILYFEVQKGEIVYGCLYPLWAESYSRFPWGALFLPDETISFTPSLGVVIQEIEKNIKTGILMDDKVILDLVQKLESIWDTWIFNGDDISRVLSGKLPLNNLNPAKTFVISALDLYRAWEAENPRHRFWYPGVQSFINLSEKKIYRVEIYRDGSFSGFEIQYN